MVFSFIQTSLVFPGSVMQGTAAVQVQPSSDEELGRLETASGAHVAALFGRATSSHESDDVSSRVPTLLFFYGNGDSMRNVRSLFEMFRGMGVNVAVADYVGYGMSTGKPSEQGCYETAEAVYDWVQTLPGVDPNRIIIGGWSLGSGVAIDLAAKKQPAGLLIVSPFTKLADVGRMHYPLLPVNLFLRHRFNSLEKIARVKCPIVIAHGRNDDIIPSSMAEKLAEAAGGPVDLFVVDGVGHGFFVPRSQQKFAESFERLRTTVMQRETSPSDSGR
ncbi:MAG TPA: alpha/beta family hydrolase [Pirellulales bacterium]|nr:alpha/beta family hydrolase [Pirellulales bacterium]